MTTARTGSEVKRLKANHKSWYLRHAIPNLARGLTSTGKIPKSHRPIRSPEVARLVAEYRARQAASAEQPVELSPLEQAWRNFRAQMGNVSEPGFTELL